MASADFSQQALLRLSNGLLDICEISPGKSDNLPLIYLPHLHDEIRAVLDFALVGKLVRLTMPYIWFLFVRPRVCLRLPSDSASRRTPLPLTNSSYCQTCSGLSPPSYRLDRRTNRNRPSDAVSHLMGGFYFLYRKGEAATHPKKPSSHPAPPSGSRRLPGSAWSG